MRCVHLIVYGRVQGVGFRYTSKMCADKLSIKGSVRNMLDGGVEIYAIAPDNAIALFLQEIIASPTRFGHVDHYQVKDLPLKLGEKWIDFKIL
ncbi:acylphosphatase [Atopobacter sp. AH10]|uniref:acylphosphatase n=1 Tax=Atopobacter sp. AH10 TaxID=2315861 RepID=UPI000EF2544D|nr:acylphosphatase [Atopobacter sp. AH10]RLK63239.1 acylphosphatase [Atopobacter sp. AH10]